MIQIELFEESELNDLEDEVNQFLTKIEVENIIKIATSVHPLVASSGVIKIFYEGLVIYKTK